MKMTIRELGRNAEENVILGRELDINDQIYYIAIRGLYSQHRNGEIDILKAKEDKEVLVKWHKEATKLVHPVKQTVYLNKNKVVEAITLELGRYISCAMTNENREKAYPRELFNKRIQMVIDDAYSK